MWRRSVAGGAITRGRVSRSEQRKPDVLGFRMLTVETRFSQPDIFVIAPPATLLPIDGLFVRVSEHRADQRATLLHGVLANQGFLLADAGIELVHAVVDDVTFQVQIGLVSKR